MTRQPKCTPSTRLPWIRPSNSRMIKVEPRTDPADRIRCSHRPLRPDRYVACLTYAKWQAGTSSPPECEREQPVESGKDLLGMILCEGGAIDSSEGAGVR